MQSIILEFPHNSRRTYTAIKHLFEMRHTKFSSVKYNDDLFVVEIRHGAWVSPFSETMKMKVVTTSGQTYKVVIESSSRSILNLLNFSANKNNVSDLSDYISNEVYRLCQAKEIHIRKQECDHSSIKLVRPDIIYK